MLDIGYTMYRMYNGSDMITSKLTAGICDLGAKLSRTVRKQDGGFPGIAGEYSSRHE